MVRRILIGLVPLVLVTVPLGLFMVQNKHHTSHLGLNLGVWATQTPEPLPVAHLVVAAGLGGIVLGVLYGFWRSFELKRKARQLEAELMLHAVKGRD